MRSADEVRLVRVRIPDGVGETRLLGKRNSATYNSPPAPSRPRPHRQKSLLRHVPLPSPLLPSSFPPSGFPVDKAEHGFSLSGRLLPLFDCLLLSLLPSTPPPPCVESSPVSVNPGLSCPAVCIPLLLGEHGTAPGPLCSHWRQVNRRERARERERRFYQRTCHSTLRGWACCPAPVSC